MSNHHHTTEGEYIPETYIPHPESHGTKSLWRTFWILLAITIVDFVIYFAADASLFRNIIFIAFGIVKAVLIVGIFMHLNYEKKFLRYMLILPAILFITYLVWLLLLEGHYVSLNN